MLDAMLNKSYLFLDPIDSPLGAFYRCTVLHLLMNVNHYQRRQFFWLIERINVFFPLSLHAR